MYHVLCIISIIFNKFSSYFRRSSIRKHFYILYTPHQNVRMRSGVGVLLGIATHSRCNHTIAHLILHRWSAGTFDCEQNWLYTSILLHMYHPSLLLWSVMRQCRSFEIQTSVHEPVVTLLRSSLLSSQLRSTLFEQLHNFMLSFFSSRLQR